MFLLGARADARGPPTTPLARGAVLLVERVVDGDTFHARIVRTGGAEKDASDAPRVKVRLRGIDCPESHENSKCRRAGASACAAQLPVGRAAAAWATRILEGKRVVVDDTPTPDPFGRWLAYVKLDDGSDLGLRAIREAGCVDFSARYPHARAAAYRAATPAPTKALGRTADVD